MNFGQALDAMRLGSRVQRDGWNGKGMWIGIVESWTFTNGKWDNLPCAPFVVMKTASGEHVPWLASQTDILAEDWKVAL